MLYILIYEQLLNPRFSIPVKWTETRPYLMCSLSPHAPPNLCLLQSVPARRAWVLSSVTCRLPHVPSLTSTHRSDITLDTNSTKKPMSASQFWRSTFWGFTKTSVSTGHRWGCLFACRWLPSSGARLYEDRSRSIWCLAPASPHAVTELSWPYELGLLLCKAMMEGVGSLADSCTQREVQLQKANQ